MARFTKKMLSVLDRAEIRRLVTLGMHLELVNAYRMSYDEIVTWIHKQPEELAKVDLEKLAQPAKEGGGSGFRDGVIMYLSQLQGFINKKNLAPEWPPTEIVEGVEIDPEPQEEPTQESEVTPAVAEVIEIKVKKEIKEETTDTPVVRLKRGGLKKKSVVAAAAVDTPPKKTVDSPEQDELGEIVPNGGKNILLRLHEIEAELGAVNNKLTNVIASIDKLAQFTTPAFQILSEKYTVLANALLFIINNAVFEEGDRISSLSELPKVGS